MIYSWQNELWKKLANQFDRLPHAILLSGPAGCGKRDFAQGLAKRLLCESASGAMEACGACLSCNWFSSGNHPDFRLIEPAGDEAEEAGNENSPEKKKKSEQIRIDQVRALDDFLGVGTHRHGARIIIIQPAEAMNQATANALLKILEEPTANTLFILITSNKKRLLPTILSRCQAINFPKPAPELAMAWLRDSGISHAEELLSHAGGMPLAAAEESLEWDRLNAFFRDLDELEVAGPVAIAGRWETWLKENKEGNAAVDKRILVVWLQKWVFDLLLMKLCSLTVFHTDRPQAVRAAAKRASLSGLLNCYNELLRIKAVAQHPLNPRLFLEDMLSRYARAVLSGR